MDYNIIKNKYNKVKEWIYTHPKEFYKYSFTLIIICFTFSVVKFIFFPPVSTKGLDVPMIFSESDEKIEQRKSKYDQKLAQMKIIVNELQTLKTKRKNHTLQKEDSLRIEYLYNQYQKLQNGH